MLNNILDFTFAALPWILMGLGVIFFIINNDPEKPAARRIPPVVLMVLATIFAYIRSIR